jgi:Zn-dependent protease/CBS domain-containing protein
VTGIPIARILGIEVRVPFSWAILLALVAVVSVGQLTAIDPRLEELASWILGGVVALGFFVSSLSHDLAHAVVARRRGVDVRSIAVSFFGATTPLDPSAANPRDDIAIAASGPVASLAIAGVLFPVTMLTLAVGEALSPAAGVLSVLVFLNLVLGLVNLVPAYPLDGGRIVRDLAWRRTGSERSGWRVASLTGRLTGLVVIGLGIPLLLSEESATTGVMLAVTGWFLVLSANTVRDRVKLDDLVGDHVVDDAMERSPATVHPGLTVDTFAQQLLDGDSPMTAVPVVEGEEVVGVLGVRQVRRIRASDWATTRVGEVMLRPPKLTFLAPGDTLKLALERLQKAGADGLPVLDAGKLVGMLTRRAAAIFVHDRTAKKDGDGSEAEGPAT